MPERVAKRVRYFGDVQGVGFLRRAEGLARQLAVFGYVKNLPDGSVELVAEGEESQVSLLLGRVAAKMAAEIARLTEETVPAEQFADFQIRR